MATSTYPATGGFVDNTSAATFIPEIWSDEIIAAYETNLVMAPLVKKLSMTGKKGDTIHIPAPTRGTATAKAQNTAVTVQNAVESEVIVTIDKHFEYSRIIEDITETQALSSLRQFYTGDAGYALAKQVDNDLFLLGKSFGDGDGSAWAHSNSFFCDASTGLTAYAEDTVAPADVFTDACFRALIQQMDDLDVPMDNRSFVMPPSLRNAITGIERYVSMVSSVISMALICLLLVTFLLLRLLQQTVPTLVTCVLQCLSTKMRPALLSKWVFVHRLSISRSS